MALKRLLTALFFTLALAAAVGCGRVTPPAAHPSTGAPAPEALLGEGLETLRALAAAEVPPRDPVDLTQRLADPGQPIPRVARDGPWGFEIGDTHAFWVLNWDTQAYARVAARLVYKTPQAYFFVEAGVDLDPARMQRLADDFEGRVIPTNRRFFGEEWSPGVDGDPRLTVLFARDFGAQRSAFQTSVDEYSRLVYPHSNEMELIYVRADGAGWDDPCTLAHELQHVIHWAVDRAEAVWLVEGFSELACQVNGLPSSVSELALGAFARRPDTQLNTWRAEIDQAAAQYGASYLFVAYFLERFGEGATRALVAQPAHGLESVDVALSGLGAGMGADALFADWVVANLLDDPGLAQGRYGYRSLDPPPLALKARHWATGLPVERPGSVGQYGADYVDLHGPGRFEIDFAGARVVRLAPLAAHSGRNVWWGGRGTNGDATLTRAFDLSGLSEATLTFYTWYEVEQGVDYAYVEVSLDGVHWTTLPGQWTTQEDTYGANYGHGYTGFSGGWVQERIDLTPYVGQAVQIRFEYVTDDGPLGAGVFLDDVEIAALGYRHEAEADDGGWVARGFSRSPLVLPQAWLLQLVTQRQEGTTVERLALGPDNSGRWVVDLDAGESAVLIVSGRTRVTTEPARYQYGIRAVDE